MLFEMVDSLWDIEFNKLDSRVKHEAIKALIDTLGVGILAYEYDNVASNFTRKTCLKSLYGATVLGGWWRSHKLLASASNAFLCHALEYDDWLRIGYIHAGCVIIPGLLSISEDSHTWADLLTNIVLGYEIFARLGAALGRGHYRYWHTTSTAGGMALAIVASRMKGLSLEEAVHAGALAGYYSGGLWGFNTAGSSVKPMSPTHAVLVGLISSNIISSGARTETRIFNVDKGLRVITKDINFDMLVSPGWDYAILYNGYKLYPCCRHTHTAIEASKNVYLDLGSSIMDVDRIEVYIFREAISVAGLDNPRDVYQARFSLKYLVALALKYGRVDLINIIEGLDDGEIRNIMRKIYVYEEPSYSSMYPQAQPCRVIVRQRGKILSEQYVEVPIGDPRRSVDLDKLLDKSLKFLKPNSKEKLLGIYHKLKNGQFNDIVGFTK